MIKMFHNEIPDRNFKIDEIFSARNKITERYTWQGTHKRTGKRVSVSGCVVYHLKNGKIGEAWNFEDMFGLYEQLGLVSSQALFGQSEE
jgi:predicted ester cyclase